MLVGYSPLDASQKERAPGGCERDSGLKFTERVFPYVLAILLTTSTSTKDDRNRQLLSSINFL